MMSGNKFEAKQKSGGDGNNNVSNKEMMSKLCCNSRVGGSISSASSRQWGGFKNPRIVRVSRSFGGKDRHSKVCTIRGLRDRRIRLSVPTAIQLYDLQERLGLSQPSKVVDWLLDATKLEIDKLPPLHFPPTINSSTFFNQFQQPLLPPPPTPSQFSLGKEKWIHEDYSNQDGGVSFPTMANYNNNNGVFVPQNFLGYNMALLNNWEPPSSLSLAQFHDTQNNNNPNNLYLPSILPPPPPYMAAPLQSDPRHVSTHLHHLLPSSSSSSQHHLHHLMQNPLIPHTLHLISSPMKSYTKDSSILPGDDDNNNPEKSSRGS